jgi:hypothetical protein
MAPRRPSVQLVVLWKLWTLVQALHRGFDVSGCSTHKTSLILGAYSPFTRGTRVSHPSSAIARCSQVRQTLSLSIPRQPARRTALEPSYTWRALAWETLARLCRALVALLTPLPKGGPTRGLPPVALLGTAEPSGVLSAETRDPYRLGLLLIATCEALAMRSRFCSGRALGRVSSAG